MASQGLKPGPWSDLPEAIDEYIEEVENGIFRIRLIAIAAKHARWPEDVQQAKKIAKSRFAKGGQIFYSPSGLLKQLYSKWTFGNPKSGKFHEVNETFDCAAITPKRDYASVYPQCIFEWFENFDGPEQFLVRSKNHSGNERSDTIKAAPRQRMDG